MSIKHHLVGATIATAVALTFTVVPFASAIAHGNKVACYGVNSCKTAKNACKGQGVVYLNKQQCLDKHGSLTEPGKAPSSTAGFSKNPMPMNSTMTPNNTSGTVSTTGMGSQ